MYVILTGVTYKKIPGYIHDSACRLCIVKKLKYFEFVLNIFEFLLVWENAKSWLVNASKLFWIAKPYFLTDIKWGYCQFLFLVFKTFLEKKIKFHTVLTIIISLYFNKTEKNWKTMKLFYLTLAKLFWIIKL